MASDAARFRRGSVGAVTVTVAAAAAGAALAQALRAGFWATAAGAALLLLWMAASAGRGIRRGRGPVAGGGGAEAAEEEVATLRALLDRVPVPLVRTASAEARAVNRAARALFDTDDRLAPVPVALLGLGGPVLRQGGRRWRVDAVELGGGHRLAALIDAEAEKRAAEDRADDEMIDVLGHELLNGLSPIVSLADSATTAAARGDPALANILETLGRRAEGLHGFTQAYRRLARLPEPAREAVPLAALERDLALLFAGRYGHGVALSSGGLDGTVLADRDQLTQALWALLQNGAEAAAAAAPPRRVVLSAAAAGGGWAIEVRDTGPGVPAPERARIFRPFHTTKPEGSGIGLSLARRIARAHGGDLTLLPEGPTAFRLRLPG